MRILVCRPATRHHEIIKAGVEINGYRVNRPGGFVITNNSGIWLWDGAEKTALIAAEVDGAKCGINDCISDPEGRLFAGSWFYDPLGGYPLGKLMRFDTDGRVSIVDGGFHPVTSTTAESSFSYPAMRAWLRVVGALVWFVCHALRSRR